MKYNRIIWSYWSGKMDKITKMCIKSWSKYAKGWEIRILDEVSVNNYDIIAPASYDELSHTTKSDVIRLSLLYQYGGLWMDASILLTEDLDNWLMDYEYHSYFGFGDTTGTNKFKRNYIESWLLFVPNVNNRHILVWLQIFNDILDTTPYNKHVAYRNKCTTDDNYYMMYQAYCYLVDNDEDFRYHFKLLKKDIYSQSSAKIVNYFKPLHKINKLVKFTKDCRKAYKYARFPLIYVYLLLVILIISFCIYRVTKK